MMLNGKRLKMTTLALHQLREMGKEVADYTRGSEISPELAAELHALGDEALGLAKLIEFLVNGVEYQLWAGQKEATNG